MKEPQLQVLADALRELLSRCKNHPDQFLVTQSRRLLRHIELSYLSDEPSPTTES